MWRHSGEGMASLIGVMALCDDPDLLVMSGGVGGGAFPKYRPHLFASLDAMSQSRNVNLSTALEGLRIASVPPEHCDTSELYGAPTLMAANALRYEAA